MHEFIKNELNLQEMPRRRQIFSVTCGNCAARFQSFRGEASTARTQRIFLECSMFRRGATAFGSRLQSMTPVKRIALPARLLPSLMRRFADERDPAHYLVLWAIMADKRLSAAAKCVATVLLLKYRNHKTGQCNPSFGELAKLSAARVAR